MIFLQILNKVKDCLQKRQFLQRYKLYIYNKEYKHVVHVSNQSQQPKVWINGQYMPASREADGKWYVEVDGKLVEVDPNDLFGVNSHWEELDASFEERKEFHKGWKNHWLALQGLAGDAYNAAIGAYKTASQKYAEVTQGLSFSELTGSKKKEAQQYMTEMSAAGSQKRRAVSDSIFYGRLAVDEAFAMQDYSNLQAVAFKISQT